MKNLQPIIIGLFLLLSAQVSHAQDFESYMSKADAAVDQMELEKAAELYDKALELQPNNIDALYGRGWCSNFWHRSQGLDDLERVIEMDSLHEGALKALASSYQILGDHEKGDAYEARAIALNPREPNNMLTLARNAYYAGEYEKALEILNESILLAEEHNVWLHLLDRGKAHFMLNKHSEAIADFERCFSEFGYGMYSPDDYEMCGDAYNALGEQFNACEYWTIGMQNEDPEFHPASEELKQKLAEFCQ